MEAEGGLTQPMLLTGAPASYGMALPTGAATLNDLAAKVPSHTSRTMHHTPCFMHRILCMRVLPHSHSPPFLPPSICATRTPHQIGLDLPVTIMDVGAQEEVLRPSPVSVSQYAAYLEAATPDHKVC